LGDYELAWIRKVKINEYYTFVTRSIFLSRGRGKPEGKKNVQGLCAQFYFKFRSYYVKLLHPEGMSHLRKSL
jgi:hypothetical protein